jgi:DNA-binding NarL/FixJ family response regulator
LSFLVVDRVHNSRPAACQGLEKRLSYSILIVDDNPAIRYCLRHLIEQNAALMVCGEAENGQIAVDKVNELSPDLVILDLQMPAMGGIEAARRITLASPKTVIVMFTMHDCAQVEKAAHAAGIAHVLSKADGGSDRLREILKSVSVATKISP